MAWAKPKRLYQYKSRRFHSKVLLIGGPFAGKRIWLATNGNNTLPFKIGDQEGRYLARTRKSGSPCCMEWQHSFLPALRRNYLRKTT